MFIMGTISVFIAFSAGVLSFFAPCILPLIPGYICFITGLSLEELQDFEGKNITRQNLKKILWQTILFVLGFSFVFVSLGATASILGDVISRYEKIIRIIGGCIIIILGLHVAGAFRIKKLESEKRVHLKIKPAHMFGSFVVGIVFAFGWTPCVGPALAAILGLAGAEKTLGRGITLLSAYSLGLGLPFILTALALNTFFNLFDKIKRHFRIISLIGGLLLIVVGILIISGWPGSF
jgi:cytochrome c-type biogenesis protein